MRQHAAILVVLCLAGCDPRAAADSVTRAAARSVVVPVVGQVLPAPQAEQAAACVIDHADAAEIESLARDVGTRAGTLTEATVATILRRPATRACLAARGIAPAAFEVS
ncbi:MAG: hypothetical protein ACK4KW_13010 [Gemmobacter sp.]